MTDAIMVFELRIVFLQVGEDNVRPVPEEYQLDSHWNTNIKMVYAVPVSTVAIDDDLNAFEAKNL